MAWVHAGAVNLGIVFFLHSLVFSAGRVLFACDEKQYTHAVQKLKKIYHEDQKDREDFQKWTPDRAQEVLKRDRIRRLRVASLFSQGCLKSAEDYLYAATVFQHGEVPDHFLQTYIWAYTAFKKGKESAGQMAGNGVDRYLMNLGYKQLFGSQAVTDQSDKVNQNPCFCLWPIEGSFPDEKRKEMKFKSQKELLSWLKELNQGKKECSNIFCQVETKPLLPGTIPGIW